MSKGKSKSLRKRVKFFHKPTRTSCRKARGLLQKKGIALDFHDLSKDRLTADDLEKLIGDRDHRDFLNTRNELYRTKNMKENPPSRAEAIRLMVKEPNLIRRPVILAGGRVVLGFDEEGIARL
jgi:arsenate reductase (glutaredoxin)